MSIKEGIFQIIGKTIREIQVLEGSDTYPNFHLVLSFTDGSCYEFYGEGYIHSASKLADNPETYPKAFSSCKNRYVYRKINGKELKEKL